VGTQEVVHMIYFRYRAILKGSIIRKNSCSIYKIAPNWAEHLLVRLLR